MGNFIELVFFRLRGSIPPKLDTTILKFFFMLIKIIKLTIARHCAFAKLNLLFKNRFK